MSEVQVWEYESAVLATGVDSVDSFAIAIQAEGGYSVLHALGIEEPANPADVELDVILEALSRRRIEAYRLPVAHYIQPEWDGSQMVPCLIDDKPGRGYIRVVMAS